MPGSVERVLETLGGDVLSLAELGRRSGLSKTALYRVLLILVLDRKVLIDRGVPGRWLITARGLPASHGLPPPHASNGIRGGLNRD